MEKQIKEKRTLHTYKVSDSAYKRAMHVAGLRGLKLAQEIEKFIVAFGETADDKINNHAKSN